MVKVQATWVELPAGVSVILDFATPMLPKSITVDGLIGNKSRNGLAAAADFIVAGPYQFCTHSVARTLRALLHVRIQVLPGRPLGKQLKGVDGGKHQGGRPIDAHRAADHYFGREQYADDH